jgi:acetyl-CoA C-acetyltransferase
VSRFGNGASDTGKAVNALRDAMARTAKRPSRVTEPWTPQPGLPDIYIAMGQTAENVAEYEKVSREEMDEFAVRSQELAVASQENGFFEREIIPVTLPDGTVVTKDDGPRAGTTLEKLATLQPVFREGGTVTAGNACPLNDGAAAVDRDERHPGQGAGHHPAGAHRGQRRQRPQPRDHGPRALSRPAARP